MPEIDLVHVHLENLFLRIITLELKSKQQFAQFPGERFLLRKEEDFRQLLRDGRAAFDDAAVTKVGDQGARDAFQIDAPMLKE